MKKYLFSLFAFAAFAVFAHSAEAKINVFACEPEWASLTREIAGDRVTIFTATTAHQDPHTITARPNLIAQIRRADLVIGAGAELEIGWLPVLLKNGKSSIQMNAENNIMAASYVKRLDVPERIDRSMGDIHADGNPHVHLNPNNLLIISDVILARLSALDSANKSFFEERHRAFKSKMQDHIKKWAKQAEPLKGMVVISHHPNMSYLFNWLGIVSAGSLEPKPGVPPTSQHLSKLVAVAKNRNVSLIEHVTHESPKAAQWLSDKTGIPKVELPFTVGALGTKDLFELFEKNISILLSKSNK
ncbi:MAG: zinc ABC transporter substrate-binding protein [Leptospirales bacterium]|nr:zinc ABC transporter substrate-binding protein [Leptospirales bacterium]